MTEPEGRWAALRSTMQFADLFKRGAPGPGLDSCLATGVYSSFELMVRAHRNTPPYSYLICSLFSDTLGPVSYTHLTLPTNREV